MDGDLVDDAAPTVTGDFHSPGAGRNVVTHTLTSEGFDASEDGTGRGTPLTVDETPTTLTDETPTLTARYGAMAGQDMGQPGNLVVSPTEASALTSGFLNGGDSGVPLALQTAFFGQNGIGVSTVAYTLDKNSVQAVAFTQNERDEVRYIGGDGDQVGALAAQPGAKQTNYILSEPIGWADEMMEAPRVDEMGTLRIGTTVGAPPPAIVCYSHSNSEWQEAGVAPTLDSKHGGQPWNNQSGVAVAYSNPVVANALDKQSGGPDDNSAQANHLVVEEATASWGDDLGDYAHTLVKGAMGTGFNGGDTNILSASAALARGAPSGNSCRVDPAPDGRRYAAMGDAITVNVAHWIGERLNEFGRLDDDDLES